MRLTLGCQVEASRAIGYMRSMRRDGSQVTTIADQVELPSART